MKTNNSIIKSIARLVSVVLLMAVGVGQMWGAAVASLTPTDGKYYIIALYHDSKYYALPHIGSTGNLYCGEECTLNGSNQVTAIAGETSPYDCLWLLTSAGSAGQFYISYDNNGTRMYLYKNGTTGASNYNISATSPVSSTNHKWEFTSGTANSVTAYSVKSLKSGASANTVLRGDDITLQNDETCYGFNVDGTSNSYEITLLPVQPLTVTFDAEGGSCATSSLPEASSNAGVTLPEASPSDACESDGWEFAGWATSAVTEQNTSPRLFSAGDTYYPLDYGTSLHAVYRKLTSGTSTATFDASDRSDLTQVSMKVYNPGWYIHTATNMDLYIKGYGYYSNTWDLDNTWGAGGLGEAYIDAHTKIASIAVTLKSGTVLLGSVSTNNGSAELSGSGTSQSITCSGNVTRVTMYAPDSKETQITSLEVTYYNAKFNSNPSCCAYEVSYSESGSSHLAAVNGMTFSSSSIATCGDAASRTITITVTPASGYTLFGDTKPVFTKTSGTIADPTITGPTDNGDGTYSYECTFAANANGAGTFAISPGQFTNYRTVCCTELGTINNSLSLTQGGNSVTISGWTYNDASSTKPAESNLASYTVRLYKKNGASWDLVSGIATGGSAGTAGTRTGIATNSKSVTFTGLVVESEYKFTIEGIGAAGYCDIAETAITSINSTDVSSTPFKFRYSICIDNHDGTNWTHHYITPTGNTDEGSVSINLSAHIDCYQFKVYGGFAGNWGQANNSGKIQATTSSNWTLDGGYQVYLKTGAGGDYVFTVDYSGTSNPAVGVEFPSANQDPGYVIYYDNSILNWSSLYYRIGNNSANSNTAMTLVPGTDKFYKVTTPDYDDMDAWHIANNYGWAGANSVYRTKTNNEQLGIAITNSIDFQQYVVNGDITVIPTTTHSTGGEDQNNNCQFYTINTPTSGMLTHTATITTPSNGTINLAYTDVSGTSQPTNTSTVEDLAHRTKITASATPATGYTLTSFTVTPSGDDAINLTSGATDNHILAKDATFAATFTAKTYNISLDREGATTGSENVTMTYNSSSHTSITAPSKDGYTFGGWWSDDNGTGSMVMDASGVIQAGVDGYTGAGGIWTKDATCTLYAKWTAIPYTISYDLDGGNVATPNPTGYTIESAAITLNNPTKDGYDFTGWTGTGLGGATTTVTIAAGSTGDRSYTATWTIKHYTVTWLRNGSNYVTPVDYTHGSDLALPAGTPAAPAGCSSKTFIGWTSDPEITTETNTKPTLLDAGSLGTVTSDVTYRAVFATVGGSGTYTDGTTHVWSTVAGFSDWGGNFTHTWTRNSCGTIPTFEYTPAYGVKKVVLNVKQTQDKSGASNTVAITVGGTAIGSTQTMGYGNGTAYYNLTFDNGSGTPLTGKVRIVVTNTSTDPGCNTSGLGSYDMNSITLYEGVEDVSYSGYITTCSECVTPDNLAASAITSTGATITWDGVSQTQEVGGSGTGFTVLWGTDATRANNSNTAHVAAGTNTKDLSGLTPATRYYVWVQSECNDEWSSSTNFYTNAKITYAAGTGASGSMDAKEVVYNAASTIVDACTFTAPSGKTFNGWASSAAVTVNSGVTPTTAVPDGATINNLTQAITLTAQWRDLNTWTINFHADNGTVTGGTAQTATETETFTFPNVTSPTCGRFIGWITSSSYNSATKPASFKAAGAEEEISLGGSPAATDYYAVYAEITDPTPTDDYVKVECEQDDWEGDYLILTEYNDGSDHTLAFDGSRATLDGTENYQTVTVSTKTITSNSTTDTYKFTIAAGTGVNAGKFSIKSASGHYIGNNAKSNGMNEDASTVYWNTIEYDATNSKMLIQGNNAEPTQLAFNKSTTPSTQMRFRYYTTSQQPIQLYKKGGCQTVTYKTSPACTPTLQINALGLTTMSYVYNAGPSASQTFTAGGKNMTEGKTITVTAPTNFQVSKDNSSFSGSVSYTVPASGEVSETIYIRLVGGLNVGTYGGTGQVITVSTNQDAVDNVTSGDVNGSVTKATASMAFTPNTYEATYEGSPVIINFTFSLTGDGTVAFSRSPAANSRAVETDGEHTFTALAAGEWTITAVHTPGDNYSKASNATATVRVKCVDTYVDFIHNKTIKAYGSGSTVVDGKMEDWGSGYTVPYIDDNATETSGSCQQTHFKFMGWVVEDEINIADGTFKTGWTLIEAGTASKTATTKTYYAVWAKLED